METMMESTNSEMSERQSDDATNPGNGNDNVNRIRDILFGPQMRDYDGRFQRLDERLTREGSELRDELRHHLQTLESHMKSEFESLASRIKAEQAERTQAHEHILHQLTETARGLELRIGNLDRQAAQDIHDLRERLLEHGKALSAEMKEKQDQLKGQLDQEASQIRDAMTGREALAEMLSEVALRLKREFRIPNPT